MHECHAAGCVCMQHPQRVDHDEEELQPFQQQAEGDELARRVLLLSVREFAVSQSGEDAEQGKAGRVGTFATV